MIYTNTEPQFTNPPIVEDFKQPNEAQPLVVLVSKFFLRAIKTMDQSCSPGSESKPSFQWALDIGVQIRSVEIARTAEQGQGIVANRHIKVISLKLPFFKIAG